MEGPGALSEGSTKDVSGVGVLFRSSALETGCPDSEEIYHRKTERESEKQAMSHLEFLADNKIR